MFATRDHLVLSNNSSFIFYFFYFFCHRELHHRPILPHRGGGRWPKQPIRRRWHRWHHPQAPASGRPHLSSSNSPVSCCWRNGTSSRSSHGCFSLFVIIWCLCQYIFMYENRDEYWQWSSRYLHVEIKFWESMKCWFLLQSHQLQTLRQHKAYHAQC